MFEYFEKKAISLRSKFREVILRTNNIFFTDMYLTTEKKQEFFKTYGTSELDTGTAEGQIALFSYRIAHLTEHLKRNKKDFSTQRGVDKIGREKA